MGEREILRESDLTALAQEATMSPTRTPPPESDEFEFGTNDVQVVGRVSGEPTARALPSGDQIVSWRVVVPRPPDDQRRARSDTLDCVAFRGDVRRRVTSWKTGDVVEVRGSLRRRFWRGPAGLQSRYEIEVTGCKRAPASRANAASPPARRPRRGRDPVLVPDPDP